MSGLDLTTVILISAGVSFIAGVLSWSSDKDSQIDELENRVAELESVIRERPGE